MGAGVFPAGGFVPASGGAGGGLAPVAPLVVSALPKLPLALYYNPQIYGFVQNADGTMASVHPVDQKMALALFVEQGSIASAADVGNRLRKLLNRVDPNQVNAIAGAEITRITAPYVAAGEVTVLGFTVQQTGSGRTALAVSYINLRDPRWTPANATAAARSISGLLS